MRQDITMDLFSNAVFPFTVAASIAVITGFFHASGVSLNSDGDRVSFQKIGIEPIPIMSLMTMIFGIFATAGFSIRYFASRSEEHTSEFQSLMRISYAVFCLKKKK